MLNQTLARVVAIIDTLTEYLGKIISWFTLVLVCLTFAVVLLRYGFEIGSVALQESVLYFHAAVILLGAGYTLKHDDHVRVDIFYQNFSDKSKALVNLIGAVLLLLPVCIFIFYVSIDYVLLSWQILEKSQEPGGLPLVFINKSLVLALVGTLVLQGIAEIARNLLVCLPAKKGVN
ncbi:TRAP transporter small permease subunit [Thalassomonas sp. M1454]|uniref:TRAP transporter small permease subunit n=1 Tax=Thalassomonas sp. M1454 TaxID=2594477 RepID=UPI001181071C|nr:TRAP transporter small permease subunit [Thalassomonas sp. M1454]TRX55785.1 TRAP transporter small permease subunit [Thalassomonas sp. M1454]